MRGQASKTGDTKTARNGYHYTRTEDRWRLTHHIVAETKLGRSLKESERVTFKDRNRKNLDPDNLIVVVKGATTVARERARLEARIAELQAQLRELLESP
jgi:hypothetical protein